MRILHSSDWHLGRIFHGVHLTEDQAFALEGFVEFAKELEPDVIVIAGDLYDRAVPPPEAVELLDEILGRVVLGLGIPTIAIAGNHDSPERIGFGSRLLRGSGLHLSGPLGPTQPSHITLEDSHGPVDFISLPYASVELVRATLPLEGGEPLPREPGACLRRQIEVATAGLPARRRVAIAHAFVVGGEESESERALTVGGTGAVPSHLFEGFAYTALGHLHRPQSLRGGALRYSGSLLPYSFSELGYEKSVTLAELGAEGELTIATHSLPQRRGFRIVEGTLEALLAAGGEDPSKEDYLLARLLDRGELLNPMARLREVYPQTMHIERVAPAVGSEPSAAVDRRALSPAELFAEFFLEMMGEPL
ncbi:MAG: exonuclease SbcCD subunit D, partial [Myxococcales bacterium]|nr:exonuclease SbcCD subunit D [Myxococcales bacterium]